MSFTSLRFALFAVLLILLYYLLPKKWQWGVLLVGSYVFYCFAGVWCLVFLLATTLSTYIFGRWLDYRARAEAEHLASLGDDVPKADKKAYREHAKKARFRILVLGLVIGFGILAVVKYTAFALDGVNSIISGFGGDFKLSVGEILLPLGISFYIFSSMSYLIDIYRSKVAAERNFFKLALFVSYFPKLVQGPISRYGELSDELFAPHTCSGEALMSGGIRVLWGYFKKLVIADRVLIAVRAITEDSATYSGVYVLMLVVLYSIVIYADFTGGMDITIGLSRMLGIKLTENFDRPFSSHSTKEYWRRWHITMGTWFTDYVFYPLSVCNPMQKLSKFSREKLGKKLGKRIPVYLATIVTWFLTGLWHGAGWNFIVWGLLNCLVILVSQEFSPLYDKFHKACPKLSSSAPYGAFMAARTFMIMGAIRILDVYRDVPHTFKMLWSIVSDFNASSLTKKALSGLGLSLADVVLISLGILLMWGVSHFSAKLDKKCEAEGRSKRRVSDVIASRPALFACLAAVLIIAVAIFGVYGFGYDSSDFIYRQF